MYVAGGTKNASSWHVNVNRGFKTSDVKEGALPGVSGQGQ